MRASDGGFQKGPKLTLPTLDPISYILNPKPSLLDFFHKPANSAGFLRASLWSQLVQEASRDRASASGCRVKHLLASTLAVGSFLCQLLICGVYGFGFRVYVSALN